MNSRASVTSIRNAPQSVGCLLAPTEVAARMAVSRGMVYKLVRTGELAAVYIGRLPRIAEADLAAFLERQRGAGR